MVKKNSGKDLRKADSSSESTRDVLLEAAIRMFAQKGFDGTTVKDISDAAGVNISLISYHFQGKEGLYMACLEQFGKHRLSVSQRLLQPPSSAEEFKIRLEMFLDELLNSYVEKPELHQIVHRECDMHLKLGEDVFRETFLKIYITLVEFISVARDRGVVRESVDPQIGASLVFGSFMSILRMDCISERLMNISLKDEAYRERLKQQFIPIFFDGLGHHQESQSQVGSQSGAALQGNTNG